MESKIIVISVDVEIIAEGEYCGVDCNYLFDNRCKAFDEILSEDASSEDEAFYRCDECLGKEKDNNLQSQLSEAKSRNAEVELALASEMEAREIDVNTLKSQLSEAQAMIKELGGSPIGITSAQYHAALTMLWDTLGNPVMDSRNVFERVRDKIANLQRLCNDQADKLRRIGEVLCVK
jgi:hypothetical protein